MPVSVSRRPQEDSMTTTRACLTRWRLTIENTDLKWKSKIRLENSNSIEYPNHIKDPNPERRYDTCSLLSSGGKLLRSLAKVSTFCFQPNNLFSCRFNSKIWSISPDDYILGYEIVNEPWCGDVYEVWNILQKENQIITYLSLIPY